MSVLAMLFRPPQGGAQQAGGSAAPPTLAEALPPVAAGVPGMVAGMLRHLHSLRRMERDHGWIHTMLEEAENERM